MLRNQCADFFIKVIGIDREKAGRLQEVIREGGDIIY